MTETKRAHIEGIRMVLRDLVFSAGVLGCLIFIAKMISVTHDDRSRNGDFLHRWGDIRRCWPYRDIAALLAKCWPEVLTP